MTTKRRLAAVEGSLDPIEVVLRVVAEGQEYASLDSYAGAIAGVPVEAAPMSRIATGTEASVRSTMKSKPREEVEAAVRRAVGDAIFRYILFLRINTAALEVAEREGLRASATFFWMGSLLGGPREADLEPAESTEHKKEQADAWRLWRGVVASILVLVMVEEDAREQLESRYLGGRPALLAESQAEWDRVAELVDRLWSISEKLAPSGEDEHDSDSVELGTFDQRVADRVRQLADDARISTFDRMGENSRAVAIMERRLRTRA
jgi:hypothetical protein